MRSQWINELVDAGYEAGVVATLNNNELAELVQEEFVTNTWSAAARAAAKMAKRYGYQHVHSSMAKGNPSESIHHFQKGNHHTISISGATGTWSHVHSSGGVGAKKRTTLGHGNSGQLGKHLRQIHGNPS